MPRALRSGRHRALRRVGRAPERADPERRGRSPTRRAWPRQGTSGTAPFWASSGGRPCRSIRRLSAIWVAGSPPAPTRSPSRRHSVRRHHGVVVETVQIGAGRARRVAAARARSASRGSCLRPSIPGSLGQRPSAPACPCARATVAVSRISRPPMPGGPSRPPSRASAPRHARTRSARPPGWRQCADRHAAAGRPAATTRGSSRDSAAPVPRAAAAAR